MRTIERQSRSWQSLLKLAEATRLHLSYRGINDKEESLFELKNGQGTILCAQGTEKELSKALETREV